MPLPTSSNRHASPRLAMPGALAGALAVVLVTTGMGAKRVLRPAPFEDYSYLTLRLSVGVAF